MEFNEIPSGIKNCKNIRAKQQQKNTDENRFWCIEWMFWSPPLLLFALSTFCLHLLVWRFFSISIQMIVDDNDKRHHLCRLLMTKSRCYQPIHIHSIHLNGGARFVVNFYSFCPILPLPSIIWAHITVWTSISSTATTFLDQIYQIYNKKVEEVEATSQSTKKW